MGALGNQKYTGAEIQPTIVLKYGTRTLQKGTDFDVTYNNNKQPGTATVTITGKGNYTGTRTADFKILKTNDSNNSSSGSGSSSGRSALNGGEDDEEDEEEEKEEDESEHIGELMLDGMSYGTIVFDKMDRPKDYNRYIEALDGTPIKDEEDEDADDSGEDEDEEEEEDEDEEEAPAADADMASVKKRYIVEAINLQDDEGKDIPLDEEQTREKYEELHLKLTPNQVDVLKSKNFVELVYVLENAELVIQLDELTKEIDVTPFEKPVETEYVEPEADVDVDEELEYVEETNAPIEGEEDEEPEFIEVTGDEETVMESVNMEMTNIKAVNQYDFCILQLTEEDYTEREKGALEGVEAQYPYRVLGFAINGEVTENVAAPEDEDEEDEEDEEEREPVEAPANENVKPYPLLDIMKRDELRLIMEDEPTEDTKQLFVAVEDAVKRDKAAVKTERVNYVETEDKAYASFAPEHNGLYAVIEAEDTFERCPYVTYAPWGVPEPSPEPEEDEEEFELIDFDGSEDSEDEDEDDTVPEPTPLAPPPAAPEPEPEVIEDPEPTYAYSRRSNEGNQYWLVDTRNKTVEYFSGVNDEYWIGDYTGSLMSGMDVKARSGDKIVNIALKFQQTYKFALMNGDGPEMLMEQDDVAKVEAEMSTHRK